MSRASYNLVLGLMCGAAIGFNGCMMLMSASVGLMNWGSAIGSGIALVAFGLLALEGKH